jgi:circadian clock protein KaiC
MQKESVAKERSRLSSGVEGLDGLLSGGFPSGSLILVSGRPGTGKTLLATQFLYEGATHGERSLYVSFAETKEQFLANMEKFGLRLSKLIDEGTFSFMDLTTTAPEGVPDALDLIVEQVTSTMAKRLVIDSFTALAQAFEKVIDARMILHVVLGKLVYGLGCTTMVLAEMPFGVDKIGLGIEEFVADGIIVMDVASQKGNQRRTFNIRKMRGTEITLRPSSYEITKNGITIFPAIFPSRKESIGDKRVPTGIPGFDELVEGGLMERSVTGITGVAGTGKTTFGMQFAYSGAKDFGENVLFVSFSESSDQIRLVARKLGMARLEELEKKGRLRIETVIPESYTPEGLVLHMQKLLEEVNPKRVVLDDATALDAMANEDEFYRMLNAMAKLAQRNGATVIISMTTNEIVGTSITGKSISTLMDGIILLRYVEVEGAMDRTMIVLKMRATKHDNSFRKFVIAKGGIEVESAFQGYAGLISGVARRMFTDFEEEERRIAVRQKERRVQRRTVLEKRFRRLQTPKSKTVRRKA